MRKITIILSILFLIILSGCSIIGGTTEPTKEPTNVETEKTELPTVTPTPTPEKELLEIYLKNSQNIYVEVKDKLNTNNLVIMAKFSDGTELDVSDKVTFKNISTDTAGEKNLVAVYEDKSLDIKVQVVVPTGIEIDYSDAKINYELGEKIDLSGLFVYTLCEGDVKLGAKSYSIGIKDPNGLAISINDLLTKVGTYVITISNNGYIDNYSINVASDEILPLPTPVVTYDSLELDLTNVKKEFNNEEFNYNNLVLNAKKSDNTKEVIPNADYKVELNTPFTETGEYTVTVTYTGSIDFDEKVLTYKVDYIKQPVVTYDSLELDLTNVKKEFNNEEFNYNNLVLNAKKSDNTKEVIPNADYKVELNTPFTETGEYTVTVTYTGSIDFDEKVLTYKVDYTANNTNGSITVTFGYSGYQADSFDVVVNSNNPRDYISAPNGYFFTGFSQPINEWQNGDFIKIYVNKINSGKYYVAYVDEGYGYINFDTFDANTTVLRDSITVKPRKTPEGQAFLYWDLPYSFVITENILTTPVFGPESVDLSSFVVTEDETVENVSANAVDVNVDQFLASTPEGFTLSSITLGINGEVVHEIPYTEGMRSAYFTDLTIDTSYEVGAYYEQNQETTLASRKAKQLTYRFHFVGFMIVTKGDVLYRVRLMYEGDCLYRWYFAKGTDVTNREFYYNVQLPIEYEGYTLAGSEKIVGTITSDVDVEAEMIPPASDTCTVVFYDKDYLGGLRNILKTEIVTKGGTATPPEMPSYSDEMYEYNFSYWSGGSYTNVTDNQFLYPVYYKTPLYRPYVRVNLIVGDTFIMFYGETDYRDLWLLMKFTLKENYNVIKDGMTEVDPNNVYCIYDLKPDTDYVINFEYETQQGQYIEVNTNMYSMIITTKKGTEKLGSTFTTTASSHSIRVESDNQDVDNYIKYQKDSNGEINDYFTFTYGYEYAVQNTTYYFYPVVNNGGDIRDVYFDEIVVTTKDATKPTVTNAVANHNQGILEVNLEIADPSEITTQATLYYKVTDNNSYITKSIPITGTTTKTGNITIDLSVVDPETGITHYYELSDLYIIYKFIYNGYNNTTKHQLQIT